MESITLKINHKDHSEVELINPKGEKFIFNPNIHEGFADFLHCVETIKSDNTETLANALQQIEKLEVEKKEMVNMLERCENRIAPTENHSSLLRDLNELIQKHKQ